MEVTTLAQGRLCVAKLEREVTGLEVIGVCKTAELLSHDPYCHFLAVDLSEVDYIDSSGLGGLIFSQRVLEKVRRRLVLVGSASHVKKLFRDCCCDRVFTMVETVEQVLEPRQEPTVSQSNPS